VGSFRDPYESTIIFFRDKASHSDSLRPDSNTDIRILSTRVGQNVLRPCGFKWPDVYVHAQWSLEFERKDETNYIIIPLFLIISFQPTLDSNEIGLHVW
jgi:hypothetical protein